MNFVKCRIFLTQLKKVRRAGDFLWSNPLFYIRKDRFTEEGIHSSSERLLECKKVGSIVSITHMNRLLKDKTGAEPYRFVVKDVPAKSYIITQALPVDQQISSNCDLQRHIVLKQSSMVRTSYMDEHEVLAKREHFKPTPIFALEGL